MYDGERPREFTLIIASDGFFPALRLQPQLGRWFDAGDFEAETGAIVISHDEWQRLLGGDPNAIGRMIETSYGRMRACRRDTSIRQAWSIASCATASPRFPSGSPLGYRVPGRRCA